ncbi:MAG: lysostaphin resistance A-like protein [Anaerolineales bacterium]|jgi:membrane protease YdiL (CAAX protease family)
MAAKITEFFQELFTLRWKPSRDLLIVAISWVLVVGALYTATVIVGTETGGGLPYFFLYAVLGATVCGIGIPLFWTVVVKKRPLSDLGISPHLLGASILIQLVLAAVQYLTGFRDVTLPAVQTLIPLLALSLAIGFFEVVFWRGWVQLRIEAAFGILPGIVLAAVLYAAYHIGYGMSSNEMVFLFFIGLMFAVVFRLTRNIFILWPLFQPMGQLITLINDQLTLPLLSALGFIEVLIAMLVLVWLASRYARKHQSVGLEPI